MKKLLIILSLGLIGCTRGDELQNQNKFDRYDIIIIEDCEYIQYGVSYGYLSIEHKGNCKNHKS